MGWAKQGDTQLVLLFANKEAQDGLVVINGILSYSDHEVMVFELLKGVRKEHIEPELHKNRFWLIQKLEDGIPVSENSSEWQTTRLRWLSGKVLV